MPPLYVVSYVDWPWLAKATTTSPAAMLPLSTTSLRAMRATTVESTMIVRTKSPTSAVSPPVERMSKPSLRRSAKRASVPWMISRMTSPGMRCLLRPMVLDTKMGPVHPTQSRSSTFMMRASWAMPFQTLKSPVSFQYM